MADDPRLAEARAMPIEEVADRLGVIGGLKRAGREFVGPCPACGGRDRFSINTDQNVYNCRSCGGGDVLTLVMLVLDCAFPDALEWAVGERQIDLSEEEIEARRVRREEEQKRRDEEADAYRRRAVEAAHDIYRRAAPGAGTLVEDYLRLRCCLKGEAPRCLKFMPNHRYVKKENGEYRTFHEGPAMIAPITLAVKGRSGVQVVLRAVHQTWIDLDQPKGKALIHHPDTGEVMDSKLVRGSKKGGAIRLVFGSDGHLIMGEGIETTLTAWAAGVHPKASFWAGVDLGNMSGKMEKVDGVRWSGRPDMQDREAFIPPDVVSRFTHIMDGDSNQTKTRAQCEAGLKRAMAHRQGLEAFIAHPGEGRDLNDIAMAMKLREAGT